MVKVRFHRLAIASVALALSASQASAHARLVSAVPAAGSTVAASPSELDLTFSEAMNLKFTGVKVTGPGGAAVATGAAATKGKVTLVVPIGGNLAPGTYTVEWHALSADGHKTGGTYKFSLKP